MESYTTGTGQKLQVHDKATCSGSCPIHNPSDHPMINFPTHWRDDSEIMERICPHGIGHPDPDDKRVQENPVYEIHRCDGCCEGKCINE